ncbi:beta-N-acetylhexosaminidase [Sinomicrobium weinanense]|uniref:beta-N-acetylhexosaminidase n=1 Tax=Sinomicrobium weinanense TaxID=2842200 RepID=A0A926Q4G6_9FLAO|nr:beta-N-acetylhexosaminidase [Sinomicrobium weinanense]MBC9796870.1 beta-N-acetylhexosaminidase [Sinomicrobium weinanense]MBU3123879.1 beta-N-acetylhexosaminidase [Sinomicrobium weinanense]
MRIFRQTTRFCILTAVIFLYTACKQEKKNVEKVGIVPQPSKIEFQNDVFVLDEDTKVLYPESFAPVATFFSDYVNNGAAITMGQAEKESGNTVIFKEDSSISNPEAYKLSVTPKNITVSAASPKGAFYAIQSLRQLMPVDLEKGNYTEDGEKEIAIPTVEVYDEPRFVYRGQMLDVGRHFFPVEFIKKYIDLMAMFKFNTFHWHLTEDQGWRIEIKKYPELTEVSAYRDSTLIGHYNDKPQKWDRTRYGGFYTQEEIKEVVKYAQERYVTVIPEIEMPGHSEAVLAAYPELGCTGGGPYQVQGTWGIHKNIYCTREETFKFLEGVLDEVIELFPSKYIHIGGDEAPKDNWEQCEVCQALIRSEGLADEHELQSYFIHRMEKYLNSKGKQIIGWDEILEGGLAPNATVMSWRGTEGAVEAAKQHHDVILTPTSHCYLDYYQYKEDQEKKEPLAIGGYLPLQKVYSFEPVPEELTPEEEKYVLGSQVNLWTEYIETPEKVEYMEYPRAIAMAEVAWSAKENKDYDDFLYRLEPVLKRLDALDVNYGDKKEEGIKKEKDAKKTEDQE